MPDKELPRRKLEGKQVAAEKEQLTLSMPGAANCVITLQASEALFWQFHKPHNMASIEAVATLSKVTAHLELSCSGVATYSLKPPAKGRKSGRTAISASVPVLTNLKDLDAWSVLKVYKLPEVL